MTREDFTKLHGEEAWTALVQPLYDPALPADVRSSAEQIVHEQTVTPVLRLLHVPSVSLLDVKLKLGTAQ